MILEFILCVWQGDEPAWSRAADGNRVEGEDGCFLQPSWEVCAHGIVSLFLESSNEMLE